MLDFLSDTHGLLRFFFNDTATTEIYTLSLHDALPISRFDFHQGDTPVQLRLPLPQQIRSEEHTSELQSHSDLVCRLLLEKKKSPVAGDPGDPPRRDMAAGLEPLLAAARRGVRAQVRPR